MKSAIGSAFLLCLTFASASHAVLFDFPEEGWYQLQDPLTYEEKCTSASKVCDVPAGDYILLNHSVISSDPGHRTTITIVNNAGSAHSLTTQYRIETMQLNVECISGFPGRPESSDDFPCIAHCPDNYTVTGGACRATSDTSVFIRGADGLVSGTRPVQLRVPVLESLQAGGYGCELDKSHDYTPFRQDLNDNNFSQTEIVVTAYCSTIVAQ